MFTKSLLETFIDTSGKTSERMDICVQTKRKKKERAEARRGI